MPALEWRNHLGLLIGVAASTIICFKLLAVAGWDSTTALGILSASGTANVLIGTLLTVLPLLYGAFAFLAMPIIERNLKRRTPVERSAARLLETWPAILLMFIVPVGLLLAFIGYLVLTIVLSIIQRIRARRPATKNRKSVAAGGEIPSRFEALSAGLAGLVILLFGSLSTPWVPPETVVTSSGEQTAYVLKNEGDSTTVLLAESRALLRLEAGAVTGRYCERSGGWWNEPILQLFEGDKYPICSS